MVQDDLPPLAVFDCQLFLQAMLLSRSPAAACFDLLDGGRIRLALSHPVLAEVREVLSRPKLLRKYPQLASPHVAAFLAAVVKQAELLDPVPQAFSYPRDPKDQPYLDLAIATSAEFLVSRDKDILDLREPTSIPGEALRQLAPQLAILDPVEFLRRFPEPVAAVP